MKILVIFFLLIKVTSQPSWATENSSKSYQAYLHTGFNQLDVNGAAINSITSRASLSWLMKRFWALDVGYSLVLSSSGSSNFTGYDLGFKYFFNHQSAIENLRFSGSSIEHRPTLAPYLGGIFAQRALQLSSGDVNFTGPGVRAGVIWCWNNQVLIDFSIESLDLKGPLGSGRSATYKSNQVSTGIGLPF